MNRHNAGGEDLSSIPGNTHALANEVRRIRVLADGLKTAGRAVRGLRVDSWRGKASERFADAQFTLGKRLLHASDAFDLAADAVERHQFTLEEAQPRARFALEQARSLGPGAETQARETVDRLRRQVDEVASSAAISVAEATGLLNDVERAIPVALAPAQPQSTPPVPVRTEPVTAPAAIVLPNANTDLADYEQQLRRLCRSLLSAPVRTA